MRISAEELCRVAEEQLLLRGSVEIPISGGSMLPTLRPGRDRVRLAHSDRLRKGDIVLARVETPGGEGVVLHRVVAIDGDRVTLMGDANLQQRERCPKSQILGKVTDIISNGNQSTLRTRLSLGSRSPLWLLCRLRRAAHKLAGFLRSPSGPSSLNSLNSPSWGMGLLTALCGAAGAAASLFFVACTKYIVDLATKSPAASLTPAVAVLIAAMLLQLLLNTAARRLSTLHSVRYSNRLRSRLFAHLLRARWGGRGEFHSGESVNRLTTDVAALATLYTSTLPSSLSSILMLIAAFAWLVSINAGMALAIVCIMPVALALSKVFARVSRRLTETIRQRETALFSNMQESLQHRLLFSTLQYTRRAVEGFDGLQRQFYAATMRRSDITLFASGMVTLGFMAGYTVAFIYCVQGLRAGAVSFGVMTAFMQLVAMVQRPVVELARKVPTLIQAQVARRRVEDIFALPLESGEQSAPLPGMVGVRFEDVTFRYPDSDKDILHDFSRDFPPGEISEIRGETGMGKTTMLLLMLGVLTPQRGSIILYNDGEETGCTERTRSNFAYVPQGNSLQSGTVRTNLQVAAPEASEAEMRAALHAAAADFVLELPEGLDTACGERGTGFSEGQAQRIAIARGLLRKGSVILLDEPTAALDRATAATLLERLRRYAAAKTILMVTHR